MPVMRMLTVFLLAAALPAAASPALDEVSCLERYARAYPDTVRGVEAGALVFKSGETFRCGTVQPAQGPYEERLARASLADQLSVPYIKGRTFPVPTGENDPGRMRHIPFFKAMYGGSEGEVRANLVAVDWLPGQGGGRVWITKINGVDQKLARVSEALSRLPAAVRRCATPVAGTFNWRVVAGTGYLSAHSFGIAIDINVGCSDYWLWDNGKSAKGGVQYRNRIPLEIVEAFEAEGFIWGGKWAHYDTMHFEYRPELLQ